MKPTWKTIGIKHMSDGTVLRLELNRTTGLRRVQKLHRFPFLGWRTLPEHLGLLEALMFNCPTRLAVRRDTDEVTEVCTNNVLLPHYVFLPLDDPRHKRYIASHYATVKSDKTGDSYFDQSTNRWRPLADFFTGSSLPYAAGSEDEDDDAPDHPMGLIWLMLLAAVTAAALWALAYLLS